MIPTFDFQVILDNQALIIKGLKMTLFLTVVGNFFSLLMGTVIGIGKASNIKPVKYFCSAYVEVFRNTPLLVQVYFFYFGLNFDAVIAGLSGLCTYTSSYMAEVVRAGIQAVPDSELKAADALGINTYDKIFHIILPRAFRIIIPPMSSQFMNLTKNTCIVYFVTVSDITYIYETIISQTYAFFEFTVLAALIYMGICWIIAMISYYIERYIYVPGLGSIEMELEH